MSSIPLTNQSKITQREIDVLCLVAMGLTNKQIAEQLVLSSHTVRAHLYSVFGKLRAGTRSAAVYLARQQGII